MPHKRDILVAPGTGAVVRRNSEKIAVYCDAAGVLHRMFRSLVCTWEVLWLESFRGTIVPLSMVCVLISLKPRRYPAITNLSPLEEPLAPPILKPQVAEMTPPKPNRKPTA